MNMAILFLFVYNLLFFIGFFSSKFCQRKLSLHYFFVPLYVLFILSQTLWAVEPDSETNALKPIILDEKKVDVTSKSDKKSEEKNQKEEGEFSSIFLPNDRFIIEFESLITYTVPLRIIPIRHTYVWNDLFTQYFLNKNTSFSNLLRVYKTTLSQSLSSFPFQVAFFPTLAFQGSFAETLLEEKNSILGDNTLDIKIGSVLDYTASKGLIFSEFTGLGLDLDWQLPFGFFELSYISYGYHGFDDVISFYVYTPKKYFGIGLLSEFNTFLNGRITPEINFEVRKKIDAWEFGIFGELGITYIINTSDHTNLSRFLAVGLLSDGFVVDANTLISLAGFDVSFDKKKWGDLTFLFRGEYRFYGRDFGNFYFEPRSGVPLEGSLSGRRSGFEFYTDVRSDEKYNNQPYNFILESGYNHGIYIRTEFEMNPFYRITSKTNLKLRNELLIIINNDFDFSGNSVRRYFANDIFSIISSYNLWGNFTINFKISNILIGAYERDQPSFFLVDSGGDILFDIYLNFTI